jgi:hypothetical protein
MTRDTALSFAISALGSAKTYRKWADQAETLRLEHARKARKLTHDGDRAHERRMARLYRRHRDSSRQFEQRAIGAALAFGRWPLVSPPISPADSVWRFAMSTLP